MRRSDRLFDIIQHLRSAERPVTAARPAEMLEVNVRTIYRDVATLQARRVPIEGAAGLGYVLRPGYDLPPLTLTADELEAVAVGTELLRRTGDTGLHDAAVRVLSKVVCAMPERRGTLSAFFVSDFGAAPPAFDLGAVRAAIRERRKLRLTYRDEAGRTTDRTIRPVAIAYYIEVTLVAGWCERRRDFRHFRVDRIEALTVLEERFDDPAGMMAETWRRLPKFG